MPGLIDGHVHATQQLLRGRIAALARQRPLKIPIWKNYLIPFESLLDPEDVYLSGLVCYANMLMVGTTCFAEAGGPHPDEMGRAALDVGIRGFISLNTADQGSGIPPSMMTTTDQALRDNIDLVERWQAQEQERVRAWLSLRQIMVCTPDLIHEMAKAARELDTKIHTHLCEGTYEIDYALKQFGKRPPEFMVDIEAFDRHVHCAHSVVLTTEDIDLYSAHRPSACHCAFNNYHIGWPQLLVMWRRGLDIAPGTDGAASWGPMDIYQVAHAARIGQQLVAGTRPITATSPPAKKCSGSPPMAVPARWRSRPTSAAWRPARKPTSCWSRPTIWIRYRSPIRYSRSPTRWSGATCKPWSSTARS